MSCIFLQGALPIFEQSTLLFLQFCQMRENSALVLRDMSPGPALHFCPEQLRKNNSCWIQIEDGTGEVCIHVQAAIYMQQYKY